MYNYQVPVISNTHQDALQLRLDKTLGNKNQLYGGFAFQSSRADAANLFGFVDTTNTLGINANVNWAHRFSHELFLTTGYKFSRLRTQVITNFENRVNVSGEAGITGNNQDPANWGPPTLIFASGIASLSDAQSAYNRSETNAVSSSILWNHGHHNVTLGGDFRRQEFNYLTQQDPRGTFTFTGVASGNSDFADFLEGIPDTSSIAYGNADKYLRQSVYDAYLTDDWRLRPELTINAGIRWEYGAPITELYGRLVNLDIVPGFSAVAPVLGSDPTGSLTGQNVSGFADTARLARNRTEDRNFVAADTGVIGCGSSRIRNLRRHLGLSGDRSADGAAVTALDEFERAEQSRMSTDAGERIQPMLLDYGNYVRGRSELSRRIRADLAVGRSERLARSAADDRDLSRYQGDRGVQEYLPNTYPIGATNPCPACPAGFVYRASNGNSTREAGSLQLRRRLRSGFTASLQYTYSKSIDDDSVLGGQGPVASSSATGARSHNRNCRLEPTVRSRRAELARPERGAGALDLRSTESVERADSVHDRGRTRWGGLIRRLAG